MQSLLKYSIAQFEISKSTFNVWFNKLKFRAWGFALKLIYKLKMLTIISFESIQKWRHLVIYTGTDNWTYWFKKLSGYSPSTNF